jgi:hypothetical protein
MYTTFKIQSRIIYYLGQSIHNTEFLDRIGDLALTVQGRPITQHMIAESVGIQGCSSFNVHVSSALTIKNSGTVSPPIVFLCYE